MIAISEASPSADNSGSDDKSTSDNAQETKDGVELAVYKFSEKDTVAFAKVLLARLEKLYKPHICFASLI